ncbi:recombinase family protein [Methylobacterium oryzae CBMB20]
MSSDRSSPDLAEQKELVDAFARRKRLKVAAFHCDEGVPGTTPLVERTGGAALLRNAKRGDIIVTASLDRLFESLSDFQRTVGDLRHKQVLLRYLAEEDLQNELTTADFIFELAARFTDPVPSPVPASLREFRAAQAAAKEFGGGKPPFGWTVGPDRKLVPDEREQAIIREMVKLYRGGMSLRRIAQAMEIREIDISHQGVKNALVAAGEWRGKP